MEDQKFFVGQEFPDVKAFRSAIKEAAIAQHFQLRLVKSDLIRYSAKCASEGCPWRIRAAKLPSSPTFTIRSLEGKHTCGKNAQNGHHQASLDWIVNFIEERLRDNINYKPKDILHDIYKQYGITIPYKQAWRAKERGLQAIYGSSEEGYCLLPTYCEQIEKINPGSRAEVFTTGSDSRFQKIFISFYASLYGFLNGCLPVICLGGIQLKSKYLGTLLSATSFDPDGGVFPLAFGIVDEENEDSWTWFLLELRKALEMSTEKIPPLTFLSDGQRSIADAVKRTFSSSHHAICMQYLSESISKEFKNSRLVQLLWKAAYSTSTMVFKEKMAEIQEVSSDAATWLQHYPSSRWALVHFEGTRYGHFSSNINELNNWILEARELPIIQVIKRIHCKLIEEFELRRSRSSTWSSILAPSAEKRIMEAKTHATSYRVLRSDDVEFEVVSAERSDIVNIGTRSCSCRDWQLYGIPCSHAVAAIISCKKDVYDFTEKYFTASSYRESYSKEVHPTPEKLEWTRARLVRPPNVRRPPGRPEKKRLCVEDINREKHTVHCSKCNQTGHYKTTCKTEERATKAVEEWSSRQPSDAGSSTPAPLTFQKEMQIWLDVVGGVKKGSAYGLGLLFASDKHKASFLGASASSPPPSSIDPAKFAKMEEVVRNMARVNQETQDMIKQLLAQKQPQTSRRHRSSKHHKSRQHSSKHHSSKHRRSPSPESSESQSESGSASTE